MPETGLDAVAQAFCEQQQLAFRSRIGAGAFKETFGVATPHGGDRALKVYRPGFNPQRAVREVEAITRCRHEHIAALYSVQSFDHEGVEYLVTTEELLPGGTLSERLTVGLLSPGDGLIVGSCIASAIETIATNRLVHRDIKPDNIMFRADRRSPVLVDFGLVRDLGAESITQTWQMQGPGTPLYAPPEQLRNDKSMIDWRSDQFSLGVVLSFAILGFHPYDRGDEDRLSIVDRVAGREGPSERFATIARQQRISGLVPMVQPWPIHRYLTLPALRERLVLDQEH